MSVASEIAGFVAGGSVPGTDAFRAPAQRRPELVDGPAAALDLRARDAETARRLHQALAAKLDCAPLSAPERVVKRSLDILGAAVLLLLLLPVLLMAAIAVRLDS